MSGHRQAAVALHALQQADRALILADLPEQDQRILRGYLDELDELGFDTTVAAAPGRPAPAAHVDELDEARASDLHVLLQGEPAALVAQLLSLRPWPWRAAYLALQTSARRDQLRAAAPDGAIAPARARFLLGALRKGLAQLPGPAPAAETPRPQWSARLTRLKWPWTR